MTYENKYRAAGRWGFSLVEVVLAIGIFLVTVLALVGLLGPTLKSVDEVEKMDEVTSVVNTLNAFLRNSPAIATANQSKFQVIYDNVASQGHATVFVFRKYLGATSTDVEIRVGFQSDEVAGNPLAVVDESEFVSGGAYMAAGPIYRAILTVSSVVPETGKDFDGKTVNYRSADRGNAGVYTLNADYSSYAEGYFAMEVRIFAEDPGAGFNYKSDDDLLQYADREPIFTYNTAIVR